MQSWSRRHVPARHFGTVAAWGRARPGWTSWSGSSSIKEWRRRRRREGNHPAAIGAVDHGARSIDRLTLLDRRLAAGRRTQYGSCLLCCVTYGRTLCLRWACDNGGNTAGGGVDAPDFEQSPIDRPLTPLSLNFEPTSDCCVTCCKATAEGVVSVLAAILALVVLVILLPFVVLLCLYVCILQSCGNRSIYLVPGRLGLSVCFLLVKPA